MFCQAVIIGDWFINARLELSTNSLQVRLRSSLQSFLAPKFSVRRAPLVEPCASSCILLASFLCAHHEGIWGVEVQLHSSVTWRQLDVSGYLHISNVSLHREQPPKPVGGSVVPRVDPDPWQKNVFPLPQGIKPRSSVFRSARSLVSVPTTHSPLVRNPIKGLTDREAGKGRNAYSMSCRRKNCPEAT